MCVCVCVCVGVCVCGCVCTCTCVSALGVGRWSFPVSEFMHLGLDSSSCPGREWNNYQGSVHREMSVCVCVCVCVCRKYDSLLKKVKIRAVCRERQGSNKKCTIACSDVVARREYNFVTWKSLRRKSFAGEQRRNGLEIAINHKH